MKRKSTSAPPRAEKRHRGAAAAVPLDLWVLYQQLLAREASVSARERAVHARELQIGCMPVSRWTI